MFEYIKQYEGVWLFEAKGDDVAYLNIAGNRTYLLYFNGRLMSERSVSSFTLQNNRILFTSGSETFSVYPNQDDVEVNLISVEKFVLDSLRDDSVIVSIGAEWFFMDLPSGDKSPCSINGRLYENYIIRLSEKRDELLIFDFVNKTFLPPFSIKESIGVDRDDLKINASRNLFDNRYLVFHVSHIYLVVIDLEERRVKHIKSGAFGTGMSYHNGRIFSIHGDGIWFLDIETGELQEVNLRATWKQHHLNPYGSGAAVMTPGNHALFNASVLYEYESGSTTLTGYAVAALNLDTLEIDWLHTFTPEEVGTGIQTPVISEDYLYVHGHNWKLHVFQRTV